MASDLPPQKSPGTTQHLGLGIPEGMAAPLPPPSGVDTQDLDDLRNSPTIPNIPAGPMIPPKPFKKVFDPDSLMPGDYMSGKYRYRLVRKLGEGGFGKVWLAHTVDQADKAGTGGVPPIEVAIKIFTAPKGVRVEESMHREVDALLRMKNDRIPRAYEWAKDGDAAFLVMQYCAHGNLHELRYRLNMIDEETAWRLLVDLLTAVKAAHSEDINHLDIKPANVLLDGKGGFLITDFGISQGDFVSSDIQMPGLGTPGYQSPEQKRIYELGIGSVSKQSDLYGIGSTVWGAYTGFDLSSRRCPNVFLSDSAPTTLPLPSFYREGTSPALDKVLGRLLASRPDDRPASAAEALQTIEELRYQRKTLSGVTLVRRMVAADSPEVDAVLDHMINPLWQVLVRERQHDLHFAKFSDGEYLCLEGEKSYTAYLLLSGALTVESGGKELAEIDTEGAFIGEVAALTGEMRTASVKAKGDAWLCVFNSTELEHFVMANPAVSIRLLRTLAKRLINTHRLRKEESTA